MVSKLWWQRGNNPSFISYIVVFSVNIVVECIGGHSLKLCFPVWTVNVASNQLVTWERCCWTRKFWLCFINVHCFSPSVVTWQSLLYKWNCGIVYANRNSWLIAQMAQRESLHSVTCQPNNVCPEAKHVFPSGCNAHVTGFIGIWETSLFFYAKCLKCDAPGWHYIVLYLPPCSSFFNKCKYLWRRRLFYDWKCLAFFVVIFYLSCFLNWLNCTAHWRFILGQWCY